MVGMPLQNRVRPDGEIVASPNRGLMMGNRGCLHGHGRELGVTRWRSKLWIACVLDWRGRQRDPMTPGRWTALFFLDEATALAAGHRPCGYCRRPDYAAFAEVWRIAAGLPAPLRATEMDARLHAERVDRTRRKRTHVRDIDDLPEGVMVRAGETIGLLVDGQFRPWSFTGYGSPLRASLSGPVEVLTPPSIVDAISAGYRPLVHPTVVLASRRSAWEEPPGLRGQLRRPGMAGAGVSGAGAADAKRPRPPFSGRGLSVQSRPDSRG
jgi:hypothetical protein